MHDRLVTYLRDNRAHIVEHWLTEAEIPPPPERRAAGQTLGIVPLAFFEQAVDAVIEALRTGRTPGGQTDTAEAMHLDAFLGITCACEQRRFGGRACIELHDSGLKAFMTVFSEDWDTDHEFNALDRRCCEDRINHALSGLFYREIEHCKHRLLRHDCPFSTLDHEAAAKTNPATRNP